MIRDFLEKWKGILIICAIFIVVVVSGLLFLKSWNTRQAADASMEQASQMADDVVTEDGTDDAVMPDLGYDDYIEEEDTADYEQTDVSDDGQKTIDGLTIHEYNKYRNGQQAAKKDANLSKRIDFDKLSGMIEGEDIAGWLYLPGTEIDYVVMKGTSEEPSKYLWKDPYGDASSTGSLFMYGDLSDEDDHRIIYGHRLKDHDLYFGPLLQFQEQDYAKDKQFLYFYDDEKVTRYRLYCVNEGRYDDMVYYYPYLRYTDDYKALIDDITQSASYQMEDSFHEGDRMLVLSTCRGNGGGKPERLYLVFREDVILEY